jgi:hypothetical protein
MIPDGGPGGVTVLLADDSGKGLAEETPLTDRRGAKTVRAAVLLKAAINPFLNLVLGPHVPARILTVDLDLTFEDHVLPA